MHINERIVGDVAIVEVIGDIVANSGDPLLKDKVSSLRQQGYTRVVVDLGQVRYMDSARTRRPYLCVRDDAKVGRHLEADARDKAPAGPADDYQARLRIRYVR